MAPVTQVLVTLNVSLSDALKIDRSFVADLESDQDSASIAAAVIALAHSLGLKVVAEGVEHDFQMDYLRDLKCDLAQGYLLGRPIRRIVSWHLSKNTHVRPD